MDKIMIGTMYLFDLLSLSFDLVIVVSLFYAEEKANIL